MPTNWTVRVTRRTRRRRTNRATTMTMTGSFMFHDKTRVGHRCKRLWIYRKLATRADHRTNPSATYIGLGLSRRPSSTNLATTLELRPAMPAKPGGSGPTGAKDIKIRHHDDDQQCLLRWEAPGRAAQKIKYRRRCTRPDKAIQVSLQVSLHAS
jgi:hypothetical protein